MSRTFLMPFGWPSVSSDPEVLVDGDPDRLRQVLDNLLSNACKFTPHGGRVEVQVRQADGAQAELVVSDTGTGIPPHVLPVIFDLFLQADQSQTRRHGGLGLGLTIVRQLVELHGGIVSAESSGEASGATFRIRLPLRPSAAPDLPARVEPPRPLPRLDAVAVLLVDDDDDNRDVMATILDNAGADVVAAASAEAAVELMTARAFDVVVTDLAMPGEDGFGLLQRVQQALPGVPVIALTAHVQHRDRLRVLEAGFAEHVPKPVDPDALVRAVGTALTQRPR